MKLPRDLSGDAVIAHLSEHWGYRQVHQVGSHVILQTDTPTHYRIAVPSHKVLRVDTLNAIIASVAANKGVSKEAILKHL